MQLNHLTRTRRDLLRYCLQCLLGTLLATTAGMVSTLPLQAATTPPSLFLPQLIMQSAEGVPSPDAQPPASGQDGAIATPAPDGEGNPDEGNGDEGNGDEGNGDEEESPQPNPVATPPSTVIVVTPDAGRNLPDVPGLSYCPETTATEGELAALMLQHPEQGRPTMQCDPILTQVARARALDMALRDYVDHATPDGLGPNQLVVAAGYPLPADYSLAPGRNNIESLAAGSHHAPTVWSTWMDLPTHRIHLLALDAFFMPQTRYGIGHVYVAESRYRHYWVVLTAPAPLLD